MRICVLTSSYEESLSPCSGYDPEVTPEHWLVQMGHDVDKVKINKRTAVKQIIDLSRKNYDVFLNLCDGAWDEDRAGIEVVNALERLNLPYTGADANFYEPTREQMKITALYYGVATPKYKFCSSMEEVNSCIETLSFPMLTKHFNSYNSVGMTKKSKCTDAEGLREEAMRFIEEYGSVLIEEFIEGSEYTVLVSEQPGKPDDPHVWLPAQCRFPAGEDFKHFQLKWVDYDGINFVPSHDESLNAKLIDMSKKIFIGLRGVGFARLDIRVSREGSPYFLEINPNCGIFYPAGSYGSADMILHHEGIAAGHAEKGHTKFLQMLLDAARERWERKQRLFEVRHDPQHGFGLFATRNISQGTVIDALEEQSAYLVSKEHVDKTWDAQKKLWFRQYCWPVNASTFVMWSPLPQEWKPINHSCDPNCWLQGLDVVARRPILQGQELTLDYATFCVGLEPFPCSCGVARCRGHITGQEYLESQLNEWYGEHISGYIKTLRQTESSSSNHL